MAPGEDFDQTGFELTPAPAAPAEATGQELLFDDDFSHPDSADAEPVFWTGGTEQAGPADDFVQADALEAVLKTCSLKTCSLTASGRRCFFPHHACHD